jgi:Fe-S-cluster containining protein
VSELRDDRAAAAPASPWYAQGLRFECTGCGRCCTGGDGYVWVDVTEIERLAQVMDLSLDEFGRRYLRRVGARLALLERAGGECVFFRDGACAVYAARPRQCASFPFWDANLASEDAWTTAARDCEGIRDGAPLVDAARIEEMRADSPRTGASCSPRR